jgi:hypothetical protein
VKGDFSRRAALLAGSATAVALLLTVAAVPYDRWVVTNRSPVTPIYFGGLLLPTIAASFASLVVQRWLWIGRLLFVIALLYLVAATIAFLYISVLWLPSVVLLFLATPCVWRRGRGRDPHPVDGSRHG